MDTSTTSIVPYLFSVTLILALAFGIYQYFRTKRAQQTHERSAEAMVNHEPTAPLDGRSNLRPTESDRSAP